MRLPQAKPHHRGLEVTLQIPSFAAPRYSDSARFVGACQWARAPTPGAPLIYFIAPRAFTLEAGNLFLDSNGINVVSGALLAPSRLSCATRRRSCWCRRTGRRTASPAAAVSVRWTRCSARARASTPSRRRPIATARGATEADTRCFHYSSAGTCPR